MTDRACHQAVIELLDGKLYKLQDDERVLLATFSKSPAFNYRSIRLEPLSQAPTTTTTTTTTSTTTVTVATATDPEPPVEDIEINKLRESVRQLQLSLDSTDMECSILASELYTAQEQSAFLKTKCDDLEQRSTEQSGTTLSACTICCSQHDEAHARMVIIKCGHVLCGRCCMTLNVDHRPGKEKLQCPFCRNG